MKHSVRIAALLLCMTMLLSLGTVFAVAAPAAITGQTNAKTETIKVNGTDTGVSLTQILLEQGSAYSLGTTGIVNLIEVQTSDKVQMKVLNNGSYNYSKTTMGKSVLAYNAAHDDSTVLAAVNGDPWLVNHTSYDDNGNKVKHVSVSRGIMIIDGELWNSHQITAENKLATDSEKDTTAVVGPAIGFKEDGTAVVGKPRVSVSVKNVTQETTVSAGGVNRLPGQNAIILYNHRIGTESFAMTDAYEIYLECENPAFSLANDYTTTGKVVGIYQSGATNRPAITEKTVIISARGTKVSTVKDKYAIGDTVSITCTPSNDMSDSTQKTEWAEVKEAIGGFFFLVEKGVEGGQPTNSDNYPCSIIGIKEDGTVLLASTTSTVDGTRSACQQKNLPKLCKELGFYSAILFDGGGSTTMITLEEGSYVRRSSTPDGENSVRSVISGVAVVYNGVNAEPANHESWTRGDLFGTTAQQPAGQPDSSTGVDFTGSPAYSYGYYVSIETINGIKQESLIGLRDPAIFSTDKAGAVQPAVINGVGTDENGKIALSGYAYVNGGQGDHYWSVDKENWYLCTDGVFSDGDSTSENAAIDGAGLTRSHAENACFEGLTANLSKYGGETVTVYFGLAAKADKTKICHYLTMEDVAVPATAWDTNKDVVLHQSFDEVRINDTAEGLFPSGQSSSWNYQATVDATVTSLSYWGWVALNDEVGSFGYQIDDAEPIWDASFTFETEQAVLDSAAGVAGATTASRMMIKIDVSGLDGEHTIKALYKNPADKAVILGEFTLTREAAEDDESVSPDESAGETADESVLPDESAAESDDGAFTDESETATVVSGEETGASEESGCASSVVAVSAVLLSAMACAVVCKKRKD